MPMRCRCPPENCADSDAWSGARPGPGFLETLATPAFGKPMQHQRLGQRLPDRHSRIE
jgi:hypothetical protein